MAMSVEEIVHMIGGDGETSYATNSRLQEKAVREMKPALVRAMEEVLDVGGSLPLARLVVADLGCSSGPNTFLVMSEVMEAVAGLCTRLRCRPPEMQIFLNDLPGNDFNYISQSLAGLEKRLAAEMAEEGLPAVPHYVAELPGSFYGRLFPVETVHVFTSSYSVQWLSQMPKGLRSKEGIYLNSGNINIGRSSPLIVVEMFQEQFRKDFSSFLALRSLELVAGGQMVLTFPGRKAANVLRGEMNIIWDLLAEALRSMVKEGLVEKEKLDTFGIPNYAPTLEEVEALIVDNGRFHVCEMRIFESCWDFGDDDAANDSLLGDAYASEGGKNMAKTMRAVSGSMIASHFGESIVDDLFARYSRIAADHLSKERTNLPVILLALKKV